MVNDGVSQLDKLMCKVDRDWRKRELLQRAASYETTRGKENYQHEVA